MMGKETMLKNLSEINLDMVNKVGGKNASLGEMIANLSDRGINVPGGFVVTVYASFASQQDESLLLGLINHL